MSSLEVALHAIHYRAPRTVAVLTGAGVSADSGIPTFRGAGGLWREFRPEDLATPEAFRSDPGLVWEWYEWRRGLIRDAKPNAAHEAIARLEDATVITQNVDGLHTRAGSRDIIELHGNIFRVRCVREGTTTTHEEPFAESPPHCACGALLRPDVVWFGEALSNDALAAAAAAVAGADLVLIIGTSGVVYPAAGLASVAKGLTIEINPEVSDLAPNVRYSIAMRAAEATPQIVDAILESRS
ncbi:MAG TPA: NAD-dependent deacylase [Thermoanaerobaculia bacterium]